MEAMPGDGAEGTELAEDGASKEGSEERSQGRMDGTKGKEGRKEGRQVMAKRRYQPRKLA